MKAAAQPETRVIPAGEFKAKCLALMDEVNATRRVVTVTKHGKPVGQFVPMPKQEKPFRSIFGRSPGIRIPDEAEWKKLKAAWAGEWDSSTKKLARGLGQPKSKKR